MSNEIVVTPQTELRRIVADEITKALAASKPTKPAPEKEVLNTSEAMKYLGVSRSTLQRWRNDGTVPFRKINGSIRYTRTDLDRVLDNNRG
ncbi:helix-turn-helix domain-containing protein [Gracilimonas tropica]|uniref:helix-turn-helix domain-containing protein n=1 Tax=Gracilimonas tropica TaxID=454600 RepID=UPI001461332D|nr:helix-turn-helix domain-containing protein [Gracilimonas tropica]